MSNLISISEFKDAAIAEKSKQIAVLINQKMDLTKASYELAKLIFENPGESATCLADRVLNRSGKFFQIYNDIMDADVDQSFVVIKRTNAKHGNKVKVTFFMMTPGVRFG